MLRRWRGCLGGVPLGGLFVTCGATVYGVVPLGGLFVTCGATVYGGVPSGASSVTFGATFPEGKVWGCSGRIEWGFVGVVWFFYVPLGASSVACGARPRGVPSGASSVTFGATFPEGKVWGVRAAFRKKSMRFFGGCGGLFCKKGPCAETLRNDILFFFVPSGASSVTFGATFPEGKVWGGRADFRKKFYEIFWGCGGLFCKKGPCGETPVAWELG